MSLTERFLRRFKFETVLAIAAAIALLLLLWIAAIGFG